jgi:hypothetical protein
MPTPYILFHLILSMACLTIALRLRGNPWIRRMLGIILFGFWFTGFAIDHKLSWAWAAMRLPGTGWVFVTNLSLEAVAALLAILWRSAQDRKAQQRAAILSPLLVGAALASYVWCFRPLPGRLTGVPAADGTCLQTMEYSCSAAAAVTLLAHHGIRTTEAQMAALCVTREGMGTPCLGLSRGLTLATATSSLRPSLLHFAHTADLRRAPYPCLISVGLKNGCAPAIRERMISYGWTPGQDHSVVLLGIEPNGAWLSVFDPTNGHERWPIGDLDYLWDNYALILTTR